MEKDNEINVNGGSYDFGARIYDSRLGRWLSLDPLMMYYPNLSAYNFAGNSPILFIDKGGKLIKIHYDSGEKDEKGQPIIKSYKYGSGLPVPDNDFVVKTIASLNMISKVNVSQYPNTDEFPTPSDMLTRLATDPDKTVNIFSHTTNRHSPSFSGSEPVKSNETKVLFNSTTSVFTSITSKSPPNHTSVSKNEYRLPRPPAASLNHELKHAFNFLFYFDNYTANRMNEPTIGYQGNTTGFPNMEEQNTTLKTDNDFNAFYCLEQRLDYFSVNGPNTSSSTSIESPFVNDPVNNSSSSSEVKISTKNNSTWE
jgi:RHS repeat-associated protein